MKIDEGLIDYNSDDVNRSLKNHYKKKYRLSITVCDKIFICNNINDEDIIIKEFDHYDQASNYIDNNFTKIKEGWNYNYYYNTKKIKNGNLTIQFNSNALEELIKSHETDEFEFEREDSIDDVGISVLDKNNSVLNIAHKQVEILVPDLIYRLLK